MWYNVNDGYNQMVTANYVRVLWFRLFSGTTTLIEFQNIKIHNVMEFILLHISPMYLKSNLRIGCFFLKLVIHVINWQCVTCQFVVNVKLYCIQC